VKPKFYIYLCFVRKASFHFPDEETEPKDDRGLGVSNVAKQLRRQGRIHILIYLPTKTYHRQVVMGVYLADL
jgi:hypothetical protein